MHGVPVWIGLAAIVLAGIVSVAWWFSPRLTEQTIRVTPHMLAELKTLKPALNFGPSRDGMYTGIPDPVQRASADAVFAHLIDTLVAELPQHPSKTFVLKQFLRALSGFESLDTEDREHAATYCERIMDVLGIESSDGVLNAWLYGPILGRLVTADMAKKKQRQAP